jgi:hypothetical protein
LRYAMSARSAGAPRRPMHAILLRRVGANPPLF